MGSLGPTELLLIAGVIVLLFGAKKLPEFARSLGKAKTEFKAGLDDASKDGHNGEPAQAELAKAEKAEAEKADPPSKT